MLCEVLNAMFELKTLSAQLLAEGSSLKELAPGKKCLKYAVHPDPPLEFCCSPFSLFTLHKCFRGTSCTRRKKELTWPSLSSSY
jgi:hypothetical protein